MPVNSSITLSPDLLKEIDQFIDRKSKRSKFVETALRKHLNDLKRKEQNLKDLDILNSNSEYLNREAEDVLTYQVKL